ncbi:L-fuconolactonase [Pseudomonas duriflava]|uniref:L-fuconolactonase n=1 Tax=Pseudomonas duriflava TaxID=459528 RepID=A0A562QJ82_9PSED|nr:amidohydrolase family protein [Pseudomonas duriflava]TWI56775.1 L-fuconolactonase [Pseudomonas duriflava]
MPLSILRGAASGHVSAVYDGPIIDTHIHLFDPTRPESVPWPEKSDPIYRRVLPADYFAQPATSSIVGAIAVEASPWRQDNFWLLEAVRAHEGMVGFVGNIVPDETSFAGDLDLLSREPLFLGVRYGNLWGRDLAQDLNRSGFLAGLRLLAESNRVLDSANPDFTLIQALCHVGEKVPTLRVVVDHLPNAQVETFQHDVYWQALESLASHEQVYMKLSEIPQRYGAAVCFDVAYYQEHLDRLWQLFGEDRILFGSDWPNSELLGSFENTLSLTRAYLATKSLKAQAKVLHHTSQQAYRWVPRRMEQA